MLAEKYVFDALLRASHGKDLFPIEFNSVWKMYRCRSRLSAYQKIRKSFLQHEDYVFGLDGKSLFLTLDAHLSLVKPGREKHQEISKHIQTKEGIYRDGLQKKIGGITEFRIECGVIDLLTASEVIEVKNIKLWKGAIGQVLVYKSYFPEHSARIHLFGKIPQPSSTSFDYIAMIKICCKKLNVNVTFEDSEYSDMISFV
jgi:hypothetical protein